MPFYQHRSPRENLDVLWGQCDLCGAVYTQWEIDATVMTAAPAVGETLTGVTSGVTAIVQSFERNTGAYADGDAGGSIVVTSPSGTFTDGEYLTGSIAGASFAWCRCYIDRRYGFSYPTSSLFDINGRNYCGPHFRAKQKELLAEQVMDIREEE